MSRVAAAVSRRLVLAGLAAAPVLAAAPRLRAEEAVAPDADLALLAVADLHSAYHRLPALVDLAKRMRRSMGVRPMLILINGDVFERGNVVARNSEGMFDWVCLGALAAVAPVVLNIGNHEIALRDDLATVVLSAKRIGLNVIGNVVDKRTGRPFADPVARIGVQGKLVSLLGLSPADPAVWREAGRPVLELPDPVAAYESTFVPSADLTVVMSHAGLVADREIVARAPAGTLILGGHDHLDLEHGPAEGPLLLHSGCWGDAARIISVRLGGATPVFSQTRVALDPRDGEDAAMRAVADAAALAYMPKESQEVLRPSFAAQDRRGSILYAAEALRGPAGADVALLNHSAFGAPLGIGPLLRYDLDNFVRFDGAAMVAEVDGATLGRILARANQDLGADFDARTGDYLHAPQIAPDPAARYRIAVSDWVAGRQARYLGVEGLDFAAVEGLRIKAAVEGALRAEG